MAIGNHVDVDATTEEIEATIGEQFRAVRIAAGLAQAELASIAGISLGAVKNLEQGNGSSLRTVVRVARALGRDDWFSALTPRVTVSPIDAFRARREPRKRVYRSR
jgi:transcriptional regulator with XRE-family HTH domain